MSSNIPKVTLPTTAVERPINQQRAEAQTTYRTLSEKPLVHTDLSKYLNSLSMARPEHADASKKLN